MKLYGEENKETLRAALNYAMSLMDLNRFEEAKRLMRKTTPVARRVFDCNEFTLKIQWNYASALYLDTSATLDDLREAANTLEETKKTARQVLGSAHPSVAGIEGALREARAALRASKTPPPGSA